MSEHSQGSEVVWGTHHVGVRHDVPQPPKGLLGAEPQLQDEAVNLVDHKHRLDLGQAGSRAAPRSAAARRHPAARRSTRTASAAAYLLLEGLPQHRVRLDAHALHGVHHHQRAVAQPRRGRHLAASASARAGPSRVAERVRLLGEAKLHVPVHAATSCAGAARLGAAAPRSRNPRAQASL
jgi:hypothetical protein